MAPPTKVTSEVIHELRAALENGATLREAASMAGISVRTLHRWIKRGFRGEGSALLQQVREVVRQARRLNGVRLVRTEKGLALRREPIRRRPSRAALGELDAEDLRARDKE